MRAVARSKGVELVLVDHTKPLLDQGEYDAIVHKLRPNTDWERNLQEYIDARPGVKVIDSLAGIRIVHNRATMLLPLRERPEGITFQRPSGAHNGGCNGCGRARVQSPTQVEILEGTSLPEADALLRSASLVPPLLVKPLWTDGREGSHGLAVLHDMGSLGTLLRGGLSADLKPPLVVQQFVEHGGVLFKVYVLGSRTVVCRRPSLGDFYLSQEARAAGVLSLPRISCKSTYARGLPGLAAGPVAPAPAPLGPPHYASGQCGDCAPAAAPQLQHGDQQQRKDQQRTAQRQAPAAPPDWVTAALAGRLREKLGLQLFNFDMICPEEQATPGERLYYVVDINYFPGVDKIPDFERVFVDFLTAACEGDGEGQGQGSGHNCGMATAEPAPERQAPAGPDAYAGPDDGAGALPDFASDAAGRGRGSCFSGRHPPSPPQQQQPGTASYGVQAAAVPMVDGNDGTGQAGGKEGGGDDGGDGLSSVPSAQGELDRVSGAEAPLAPCAAEVTSEPYPSQYD